MERGLEERACRIKAEFVTVENEVLSSAEGGQWPKGSSQRRIHLQDESRQWPEGL